MLFRSSTAIDLVNQIRGRAFPNNQEQLFKESSFNLDSLYDERGREFVWEMHRRTDMIRFGKFEDPLLFKPSTSGEPVRHSRRIGTAKFFTLLLLLYLTSAKSQGIKQLMAN